MVRVVLVDDHPVARRGVGYALEDSGRVDVVGEASTPSAAIELIDRLEPHVAILDLRLDGGSGLEVASWVAEHGKTTRCVVLSAVPTDRAVVAAFETGAVSAFLTKQADSVPLLDVVLDVASGVSYLDAFAVREAKRRMESASEFRMELLNEREREVAVLVADGLSDSQIAEMCHVSLSTVRNALSTTYAKLGVDTRTQLVRVMWLSRIATSG